jgi:cyclophilin family peptidyl-prolyl cis-trans isomerase
MGMFSRNHCAHSSAPAGPSLKVTLLGYCVAAIAVVAGFLCSVADASQYVMLDYNLTMNTRSRDTVFLELFDDKPLTTANFLQYVNNAGVTHGNYNGSIMHRLSRNFVIQGGGFWPHFLQEPAPINVSLDPSAVIDLDGNPATPNPTVVNEHNLSPIRSNLTGSVSMARIGGQPNSATNQWFVNLADNTGLDSVDGGFTVFAKVAGDGMALFNAFNTLSLANLNPDVDDNGTRDAGPFFVSQDITGTITDAVPYLHGAGNDILVILERATQIDYLGSSLTTNVPANGLTFTTRDAFIDTGTGFTGTGSLGIGNGRRLGIREAYALNRTLVNHGTVAPGLQLGSITVQGDYQQFIDGALEIQLAGTTVDTQYDRVAATGSAAVDGKLSVSLLSGFVPNVNNSFTSLTASSIIGTFRSFDLPQLASGLVWNISKTNTAYTLSVVSADYNRNGVVDMADYVLWRNSNGVTNITPYSGADGTGDGKVDAADYSLWRANFGNVQGTVSGAGSGSLVSGGLPEPASVLLLLCSGLMLATYRRRRA